MRSKTLPYLCALLSLLCAGCGKQVVPKSTSAQELPRSQTLEQDIVKTEGAIIKGNLSSWKVDILSLGGREALNVLSFPDETHGWVGGKGGFYKTADSGKTWKRVRIDMPQYADVADMFFVNPTLGWVAMQKRAPDAPSYQENQFWLMQTSDGGESWQLQHTEDNIIVTHISFIDERTGWLVGIRYTGLRPLRSVLLVLYTTDQGRHWVDVSKDLNRIATNDKGFISGWITGVIPEGLTTATVLTSMGQIYKTIDGGQSWNQIGDVHDELESPYVSRFGVKDDKHLWMAGGAYNSHGIWGTLSVERVNNSWIRYRLSGVYFADALFLSEQQVLACGSLPVDEHNLDRREGVILYSTDEGRKWSIIYRNPRLKSISGLTAVDSNHIWAVGEDGSVLRLEPPR